MKTRTYRTCFLTVMTLFLFGVLMCMPVMAATKLGAPAEAYWDEDDTGIARWEKVENAKEYEVRLYEGDDIHVKTEKTSRSKIDLTPYMSDGNWYYFKVRAVPKTNQKGVTAGEWTISEPIVAEGVGENDGRWRTYSDGKKYQKDDGTYVVSTWKLIEGSWYYFEENGYAATGWQNIQGTWYYLGTDGIMKTGWQDVDGSWYYLEEDGSMVVGWKQVVPGQWYYFDAAGKMASNTDVDGYHLNESGLWVP